MADTKRRALITGVSGQDGSYLADFLIAKGYEVFGLVRRTSKPSLENAQHLADNPSFHVIYADLTDQGSINRAVLESTPDEVYNLGAQSFVGGSWQYPVSTADITGMGTLRMLEALRQLNPKARFYQASSSEMFGNQDAALTENSPFKPRSPYGTAKAFAHYTAVNYRESFGMFTACGILFNHESPRRGIEFVTRKITDGATNIKLGKQDKLYLGNLEARRDWGDARDYVRAMWLMLQQDTPDDFVIATGKNYSIKDFLERAFGAVGLDWQNHVEIDPAFYRPAELNSLVGDATKAKEVLGWEPAINFQQMIGDMIDADLERNT